MRGLCCWAALAAQDEKAPMAGEVAGIWTSPPKYQRQGLRTNGLQELPGQYKKAADSVPLNICLLCNSYLQKHAKWHSAEECLYLISLITLFPGSGLLDELSQFSWGAWNHLKTKLCSCFDGWSQLNLLSGWCIETPALYFPFYFAVTRTVFYVRPKWLLPKPEQRMWFGCSGLLCFLKSWCPSALFMIRLMFIFSDLLHC